MEDKQPLPYLYPVLLILKEELVHVGEFIVKPLSENDVTFSLGAIEGWTASFIHELNEDRVQQLIDLDYIDKIEDGENPFSKLNFLLSPPPQKIEKFNEEHNFDIISKSKGESLCYHRTLIDVLRCHDEQPL